MISISLTEYETRVVDGLAPSRADLELADSAGLQKRLRLRWLRDGRLELTATSHVGVVELDCVRISVVPKLVGGELAVLQMVDFVTAARPATTVSLLRRLPSDGVHLRDLVCLLVTTECEQLLRRGLRRDYVRREAALTAVRGRLMVEHQALRRFGRLDRLEYRFDDLDADITDNRICSTALDLAARTAHDGDVRARARVAAADFAVASPPGRVGTGRLSPVLHYDRQNEHYRAANRWALLLLGGGGFDDLYATSGDSGSVFLINMNSLFEQFITTVMRDATVGRPITVLGQYSHGGAVIDDGTGESYMEIRPDLLLVEDHAGPARIRPVDAKYKLYDDRRIAPGDVYQACLYAHALCGTTEVPTAVLLHPAAGPAGTVRMSVRGRAGELKARVSSIGVDVPDVLAATGTDRYRVVARALLESVMAS